MYCVGMGIKPGSFKDPVPLFQNPKIINVWAYRYHYGVPSFIFYYFCNVMLCPLSRVTAFKSNQSNHCRVSTNVFEWNCKQTVITGKVSEVWQLTLLARMAERAKIIYCKRGEHKLNGQAHQHCASNKDQMQYLRLSPS